MKIHPREINTFGALVPKLRIQLCFILTLPAIQSCVTKNEIKGIAQVVDVKQGCAIAAQLEYSAFLSSPLCCWSCLHILHPLEPQEIPAHRRAPPFPHPHSHQHILLGNEEEDRDKNWISKQSLFSIHRLK